jgi:hypothetical protein
MMCRTCDRKKGCPTRKLGRVVGCNLFEPNLRVIAKPINKGRVIWPYWELGFITLELQEIDWMPARFLPCAGVEDGCYGNEAQEPRKP